MSNYNSTAMISVAMSPSLRQDNHRALEMNSHVIEIFSVASLMKAWEAQSIFDKGRSLHKMKQRVMDVKAIQKIIAELGFKGKVLLKNSGGRQYVIFKGAKNSRKLITGTRYLADNPKVVSLGVGKLAQAKSITKGCKIAFVVDAGINIAEFLLSDEHSLSKLIGKTTTDLVKTVIGAAASYAVYAAATAVFASALAPVVASIVVGVAIGYGLDYLDKEFNVTENLINFLDKAGDAIAAFFSAQYQNAKDFTVKSYHIVKDEMIRTYDETTEFYSEKYEQIKDSTSRMINEYSDQFSATIDNLMIQYNFKG